LSPLELEDAVNTLSPTGVDSPWRISMDLTFASGSPNPGPCERDPGRTHYLLTC